MVRDRACSSCRYLNESRAAFCGNCGGPLRLLGTSGTVPPSTLPEEMGPAAPESSDCEPTGGSGMAQSFLARRCPTCHHVARIEDQFCRRCGAMLVASPQFCQRCGDPIETDEKFCNRCGLPLG